jgi:hypothetical protein
VAAERSRPWWRGSSARRPLNGPIKHVAVPAIGGPEFVVARRALQSETARFYATTMFVRFRQQGNRLQASLMQTRRVSGKMQSEHIASLGSVDAEVSVRERLAFWAKLPERLARLGNSVGPDDQPKVYLRDRERERLGLSGVQGQRREHQSCVFVDRW